jgi:hypothetical protein
LRVVIPGWTVAVVPRGHAGRLSGDNILTVNPAAQVDQPAALGAEREGRQVVQRGDLVTSRTDRAATLDHVSLLALGEVLEAESPPEVLFAVEAVDSLDGFAVPLGDFSAWAAFLYESLR